METKKIVTAMVATLMAALLCVKFGFNLGTKQVERAEQELYSVSKTHSEPDFVDPSFPGIYDYQGKRIDNQYTAEPFVSTGEKISVADEYGWLLLPAASLNLRGIPVKADLSTDAEWEAAASYSASLSLPDEVFHEDAYCRAEVYYPKTVEAGETGTIVVLLSSDNGYVYCGYCQFTASDDLRIVYGNGNPDVASGGELNTDADQLSINFYTAATPQHYKHRNGHVYRSGYHGTLRVGFIDIDALGINPKDIDLDLDDIAPTDLLRDTTNDDSDINPSSDRTNDVDNYPTIPDDLVAPDVT